MAWPVVTFITIINPASTIVVARIVVVAAGAAVKTINKKISRERADELCFRLFAWRLRRVYEKVDRRCDADNNIQITM